MLQLKYDMGSVYNTIDVFTKENLMLGFIIGDGFSGTLTFHQVGKLTDDDVKEIKFVCSKIARAMGYIMV